MAEKKSIIDGGFVVIPIHTIKCKQYKSLRAHTRAVYIAILTMFQRKTKWNPTNKVTITHNQMEAIAAVGHSSVVRAVKELKDKGFIRVLVPGGLEGNPSTFQLNKRYTQSGDIDTYW